MNIRGQLFFAPLETRAGICAELQRSLLPDDMAPTVMGNADTVRCWWA